MRELPTPLNATGRARAGTVDSWLLWHLSGGRVHATDVTNASRYNLMDLHTRSWSVEVCAFYGIPVEVLPTIRSSSEVYGHFTSTLLKGVPICALISQL
jgi:glycerol kinase